MNIVVTGASKGIGKALASRFAQPNNNIFICARNEDMLLQTAEEIRNIHADVNVTAVVADLELKSGIENFSTAIFQKTKSIDILINNAGNFIPGSIYNEADGILEKMMSLNLYSAYHLTRLLLPAMIEKKKGHIFNMCSIASLHAYANGGSYSISKYALAGFSRNLREELKPFGIKVTAVYSGAVYTDSWAQSGLPEERFIKVSDIAELIYTTARLSPNACVEDLVIRPQMGDI